MVCIQQLMGAGYRKMKVYTINQPSRMPKKLFYTIAPTNRGKCYMCKKIIPKGTPRLYYWDKFQNGKAKRGYTGKLNIKRSICFRCLMENFESIREKYQEELKNVNSIIRRYKRTMKGIKCKKAIENVLVLEELEREDFKKNF